MQQITAKIFDDDASRDSAKSEIIVLGDLVDRGPDSSGVIETARRLKQDHGNVRLLMGNQEEFVLQAASGSEKTGPFFSRSGGKETMFSYDVSWQR